jgi:UDP-N-acetylglucosamine--N-acetylmuramyl-(pentapeptide) pyrophosphoryl-undecaprenol N-acetylglucosamine transferase
MAKPKKQPFHTLIACGGTGGHLYPGIAVAEVLQQRGHKVTLLISEKKIDALAASGHPHLNFQSMNFIAMPKPWSPKMIGFAKGLWKGLKDCRELIKKHDSKVVLGMGGFTSLAPLVAGQKEKRKTLIHESNAVPGKANKLNARFCDVVLCGLDACKTHFPKNPDVRVVGTPVRSSIAAKLEDDAYAILELQKSKKTLLVMGGSQGARGVNRAVIASLKEIFSDGFQILHIAGPQDYQEVRDAYSKYADMPHQVMAFCHRMELAYAVADLVVARSGASTLTELAWFGKPSLLVPYPTAADDHQTKNAEIFAAAGAAKLMPESTLNATTLLEAMRSILNNEKTAKSMRDAARKIAVKDSAERIANIVEELATA